MPRSGSRCPLRRARRRIREWSTTLPWLAGGKGTGVGVGRGPVPHAARGLPLWMGARERTSALPWWATGRSAGKGRRSVAGFTLASHSSCRTRRVPSARPACRPVVLQMAGAPCILHGPRDAEGGERVLCIGRGEVYVGRNSRGSARVLGRGGRFSLRGRIRAPKATHAAFRGDGPAPPCLLL